MIVCLFFCLLGYLSFFLFPPPPLSLSRFCFPIFSIFACFSAFPKNLIVLFSQLCVEHHGCIILFICLSWYSQLRREHKCCSLSFSLWLCLPQLLPEHDGGTFLCLAQYGNGTVQTDNISFTVATTGR